MAKVTMPQLGETVADGTVTKWFKQVGDTVTKGEPLFEVSTDKVDTEIPSPTNGVLSAILVEEGVTVDVGTVLAVIGDGSEEPSPAPTTTPAAAPNKKSSTAPAAGHARQTSSPEEAQLSPVVRRLIEENGLDVATLTGSGPNGRITRQDVLAAVDALTTTNTEPGAAQSPIVRRLMSEHHIEAKDVVGTGPNGTITRHDVDALIESGPATPSASVRLSTAYLIEPSLALPMNSRFLSL